jgi:hypothetical protein
MQIKIIEISFDSFKYFLQIEKYRFITIYLKYFIANLDLSFIMELQEKNP